MSVYSFRAGAGIAFLVAAMGLLGSGAAAKPALPTVAVMPFRDLSSGTRWVGEAIRETVTTDLKQLGALRVVERASLDRVLAEQKLQVQMVEIDAATAVRIGKVLGATLIVAGAYQKIAPQVRLTARFIKVETSEIIGTAKVDGSAREFLRLQDRVTSALLKSAGLVTHAQQVLADSARRPDLQSMKALELYGQAVASSDDGQRQNLLKLAVAEDGNFSYAVKDLAELEKRLQKYQSATTRVDDAELKALREQLARATERRQIDDLTVQLLQKLLWARRHRELAREARAYLERGSAGEQITRGMELAASLLISADEILRDVDATLRDGEYVMQRMPGSQMFQPTKLRVQLAVAEKRKIADGKEKVAAAIASLAPAGRWDLCLLGTTYYWNHQYAEAQRLLRACMRIGNRPRKETLDQLLKVDLDSGDWAHLRSDLEDLERTDSAAAHQFRANHEMGIPVDG